MTHRTMALATGTTGKDSRPCPGSEKARPYRTGLLWHRRDGKGVRPFFIPLPAAGGDVAAEAWMAGTVRAVVRLATAAERSSFLRRHPAG